MIPLPYGRQRPSSTSASSPSEPTSSAASRDLPTPGSPTIVIVAARPLRLRPAELEPEAGELRGAADERRVHPPHEPGDARLDVEQPPRRDGLGLALQLERRNRLRLHGVAHEPERPLADQDLAAAGGGLEALRDDDGVARREGLPLRGVAGEDFARVDAGPDADAGRRTSRSSSVVQLGDRRPQLDGRAHGAHGIVLVHDGDAERRP